MTTFWDVACIPSETPGIWPSDGKRIMNSPGLREIERPGPARRMSSPVSSHGRVGPSMRKANTSSPMIAVFPAARSEKFSECKKVNAAAGCGQARRHARP